MKKMGRHSHLELALGEALIYFSPHPSPEASPVVTTSLPRPPSSASMWTAPTGRPLMWMEGGRKPTSLLQPSAQVRGPELPCEGAGDGPGQLPLRLG